MVLPAGRHQYFLQRHWETGERFRGRDNPYGDARGNCATLASPLPRDCDNASPRYRAAGVGIATVLRGNSRQHC